MDLDNLRKKSVADLRSIAQMMQIRIPDRCPKSQLLALITGESDTAESAPSESAPAAPAAAPEAATQPAPQPTMQPAPQSTTQPAAQPASGSGSKPASRTTSGSGSKPASRTTTGSGSKPAPRTTSGSGSKRGAQQQNGKTNARAQRQQGRINVKSKGGEQSSAQPASSEPETTAGQAQAPQEQSQNQGQNQGQNQNPAPGGGSNNGSGGEEVEGLLDILQDGYGFLRVNMYYAGNRDVYVAPNFIRRYNLKTGDYIKGRSRMQRDNERYQALCFIQSVNEMLPDVAAHRKPFEALTPIYPDERIRLETVQSELSTRLIDLIAPIGKGQRGMIVSPPKAGKTVLLKKIANAITTNYPEIKLIVLLIDERPEEVTDMRESIQGEVVSSTFDELPERHIKVAELVFERARRLVEMGCDVVILMDSLTRLARAYNITIAPTGRSLSGGLDPGALYNPKRFFGAARNIRDGGSLTIVATALVDTGSKMDDVIFEEFKGTGNMELHLDRKLSEKRIFPAIDVNKSGTRKEELLLTELEMNSIYAIRKALSTMSTADVTEMIVSKMLKSKTNADFINTVNLGAFGSISGMYGK